MKESELRLIDTHCHLDDHVFDDDINDVLAQSRDAGVDRWIIVGFDPQRWASSIELSDKTAGMHHMLGVHPGSAEMWSPQVAGQLEQLLVENGALAVGEIGLDFYRDNAPLEVQESAFRDQLAIAKNLNLPAVLHLRNADEEIMRILQSIDQLPSLNFHSFEGSKALHEYSLTIGGIIGVGGLATRLRSESLREMLKQTPIDRIILETDAPYLVPAKQKDRRNVPKHVRTVAEFLVPMFDVTVEEIADMTTANAVRFFGEKLLNE